MKIQIQDFFNKCNVKPRPGVLLILKTQAEEPSRLLWREARHNMGCGWIRKWMPSSITQS
jgi:hypothetical protein